MCALPDDSPRRGPPIEPGQIIAGKYRIEGVLGEGGMGVVLAATHLQLRELVAIKVLRPYEGGSTEEALQRFVREARVASRIRSEHVARVYDVGVLEPEGAYIVLEYLEGQDLERWLDDCGTLPIERAVECVLQACEALAEAHAAGIIHRDLKPANLFLTRRADGTTCIKILDFGISKAVGGKSEGRGPAAGGDEGTDVTRTVGAVGSPPYLSPEQLECSDEIDARADIWALGATLFELCTGVAPFVAPTSNELYLNILRAAPPRPSALRPEVPAALEQAILRCLEKTPARRFGDVAALAAAIAPFGPQREAERSARRVYRVFETAGVPTSQPPPPMLDTRATIPAPTLSSLPEPLPRAATLAFPPPCEAGEVVSASDAPPKHTPISVPPPTVTARSRPDVLDPSSSSDSSPSMPSPTTRDALPDEDLVRSTPSWLPRHRRAVAALTVSACALLLVGIALQLDRNVAPIGTASGLVSSTASTLPAEEVAAPSPSQGAAPAPAVDSGAVAPALPAGTMSARLPARSDSPAASAATPPAKRRPVPARGRPAVARDADLFNDRK